MAPEFFAYHDTEWGFPDLDERRLFETICLESFQSGLSWRTILAKRENFRQAFAGFDYHVIARYGERDVERMLGDRGIVRHRAKIEAVINNAARVVDLVEGGESLTQYFWRFSPDTPVPGQPRFESIYVAAVDLSNDLRKRGWKFVGPTTVYAFMQASGLVNDHDPECAIRPLAMAERSRIRGTGSLGESATRGS